MISRLSTDARRFIKGVLGFEPVVMVRLPQAVQILDNPDAAVDRQAISEWVLARCQKRAVVFAFHVYFENEDDALLFRLSWQ